VGWSKMRKEYIEQHDQGYWITGTRISLDSVVVAFLDGLSPETIAGECFPELTLEQVYGAIAFYLGNRDHIDAYLQTSEAEFANLQQALPEADPEFARKLATARRQALAASS
jgi:uncharacterized protein (DUF433 family)